MCYYEQQQRLKTKYKRIRDIEITALDKETVDQEKPLLDPRVESLAISLARCYAKQNYHLREDGTFKPAWRGANGEEEYRGKSPDDLVAEGWTLEAATSAVIDIANTSYDQYSEYWKAQNHGGAQYLVTLLDERGAEVLSGLDLSDPMTRSEYGSLIHANWISRNEWVNDPSYGNPQQAKLFNELSPEEQQKDIDQLSVLQTWLSQQAQENTP